MEADGALFPQNQVSMVPKISAPVQSFYVSRGDQFQAGQLLATLENRDLTAAVNQAKGQLAQAEANLSATTSASVPEQVTKAQTDVASAQQAADATRVLLENRRNLFKQGALARKLVDDAEVAYVQAKSQLEAAKEHLRAFCSVGKEEQIKAAQAQVTLDMRWCRLICRVALSVGASAQHGRDIWRSTNWEDGTLVDTMRKGRFYDYRIIVGIDRYTRRSSKPLRPTAGAAVKLEIRGRTIYILDDNGARQRLRYLVQELMPLPPAKQP